MNNFLNKLKLLRQAYGSYRWHILLIAALGVVSSFVESIGVTTVVPVFSFALGDGTLLGSSPQINSLFKIVNSVFDFFHIAYRFRYLLVFIAFLFVFRFIFILLTKYVSTAVATRYEEETRKRLFQEIIGTNWTYLLKQKLGHLENVLMMDVGQSRVLFQKIAEICVIVGSLLVYIFIALHISFFITLTTLAFGALVFLCLYPFVKKTQIVSRERIFFTKKIAHQVNQHILGIKTVKVMDLAHTVARIVGGYFKQHRQLQIRLFLLHQLSVSFVEPVVLIYIIGIFTYFYARPNFNIGVFIVFVFLIYRIFQYVINLQSAAHLVNETIEHLKCVCDYFLKAEKYKEKSEGKDPFVFSKEIAFHGVCFSYPDRSQVLSDVDIVIAKGEIVGIVGPSGSGKTTIADLLLRLFKPTSGTITIDGKDVQSVRLDTWRRSIGYLSQDIFLTNDAVCNNISFYDESVSETDVIKAAKMAYIHDFITQLPNGYDTVIGERGIELSAGERQRVAIARVFARQPQVLILDEATSALDNESEQAVQMIIEKFRKEITVVMIAHRLTTVMNCDRIFAVQDGKIIESGVPKELLQNSRSYFYKTYHLKD